MLIPKQTKTKNITPLILKKMKRNDKILIVSAFTISVGLLILLLVTPKFAGTTVTVSVNGEITGSYSLNENREVWLNGYVGKNLLVIKNGYAKVVDADCKDKLCVRQKDVKNRGETIVCLPNRLIIRVNGGQKGELDAIAN